MTRSNRHHETKEQMLRRFQDVLSKNVIGGKVTRDGDTLIVTRQGVRIMVGRPVKCTDNPCYGDDCRGWKLRAATWRDRHPEEN